MSENKHLAPVCIIYLDGNRLSPACEGAFRSVFALDRLNGVGECTVTFDRHDLSDKDARVFSYDTRLSLHLGYKDDTQEVFNGEITGLKTKLSENGPSSFIVIASSCLQRLGHGRHKRVFENKTACQAIQDILSQYNLQADCDSFGAQKAYWEGGEQKDLELVLDIARRYGKDVYCFGEKVYVKERMTQHKEEAIYEWGKSLISFSPKMDIQSQAGEIRVLGWDILKGKGFSGGAKACDVGQKVGGSKDWTKAGRGGDGKWVDHYYMHEVADSAEAKDMALALMRGKGFKLLMAEGSGEGNCKLASGMAVTVKNVGTAFSGEYIAEQAHHRFSLEEGYTTDFLLKRNMLDEAFGKKSAGGGAAAGSGSGRDGENGAAADDEDEEEEEDGPEFRNLVWKKDGKDIDEAMIDDDVTLFCEVKNIDDGEKVKFKIFEKGENKDDSIDEVEGEVKDGEVQAEWKVVYKEDENSSTAEEIEEQGWTIPDYYFVAEYGGVESEESKLLNTMDQVDRQIIYEETGKIAANKKYTIVLPDGEIITNTTDDNGRIKETNLPIGNTYFYLNEENDG